MDWANESYVRLYTRDTKTWMLLGWEGQCLLPLILRKLDRSGVLADVFNAEDLAVMLANGMPVDSIEKGLSRLITKEVVTFCDIGMLMTNYLVAQETPKTDKQRQKESRERRSVSSRIVTGESRDVTIESQDRSDLSHVVTDGHAPSQVVTPCLALPDSAVPSMAVPCSMEITPNSPCEKKRAIRKKAEVETELPTDWAPTEAHAKFAADNGIDLALELMKFKGHFDGRKCLSWNGRFSTWIGNAVGYAREREGKGRPMQSPRMPQPNADLERDRYVARRLGETDEQLEARTAEIRAGKRGLYE